MKKKGFIILTGVVIGAVAVALSALGNPGNMGFCIACFLRDIAGACSLHSAAAVQVVRPEIPGLVLGAFIASVLAKEYRPRGGSSPMTRFIVAVFVMIGALVFLGCPLRMMLRIGGGDLNALAALPGFVLGIFIGVLWLKKGFSLKRAYPQSLTEGGIFPALMVALMVIALVLPQLLKQTEAGGGPGALHAAALLSLAGGLIVGALAQRTRFCTVAASRDAMLFSDFSMLWGFVAVIATTVVGNLLLGTFKLSFAEQPVAHTDWLWNFLGMALVGWGSVFLGGCPLRQLILAGEGDSGAAVTVTGLIVGASVAHNFGLASSGKGATPGGMIAVCIGFAVLTVTGLCNMEKEA